ncbi:MAG: hypothetical protein MR660_06895 [Peptoniphilaceae bacterium]|nr:hypothetical protein [Peptoniphilaceae bacterium]MDY4196787.1 hypothetical protein [Peptoniphilaceae bacterium]MDY5842187.1 hypothetical protein [Peptoniphilaceae bacterium]MDY6146844.1 hypothetical protein [Peptoniphilaceae bacterium]
MRYSYECKKECAELHRQGKWRNPLEGVSTESFKGKIRKWHRPEDFHGPEKLKKRQRQVWSADSKLKLISRTVAVESVSKVAESIGIGDGMLHQWICKQKTRHQMKKQANLTPFTASRRPFLSA